MEDAHDIDVLSGSFFRSAHGKGRAVFSVDQMQVECPRLAPSMLPVALAAIPWTVALYLIRVAGGGQEAVILYVLATIVVTNVIYFLVKAKGFRVTRENIASAKSDGRVVVLTFRRGPVLG